MRDIWIATALALCGSAMLAAACADQDADLAPETVSRSALKGDDARGEIYADTCLFLGLYGDGFCDEGCRRPDPDCGFCWWYGDEWTPGDTWPAGDGCSECSCQDDGVVGNGAPEVVCTEVACD